MTLVVLRGNINYASYHHFNSTCSCKYCTHFSFYRALLYFSIHAYYHGSCKHSWAARQPGRVLHHRHVHPWYAAHHISISELYILMSRIDDIDFEGSRPNVKNILGGAASFAVVGARLVTGKQHSQAVSWIVDVGSDFPSEVRGVLESWDTSCVFREDHSRLTTRAWNGYGPNEKRGK